MMGIAITVVIVLFVIGSVMALKPSGVDVRLDKLRMTAKKLALNPHLIACPEWICGATSEGGITEIGKGMIAQYSLVIDNMTMPHIRYQVIKDKGIAQFRPLAIDDADRPADFSLDKQPVELPDSIRPFVKALEIRANGISIYWEDTAYVHAQQNPTYSEANIEPELLLLKNKLNDWATLVQESRS